MLQCFTGYLKNQYLFWSTKPLCIIIKSNENSETITLFCIILLCLIKFWKPHFVKLHHQDCINCSFSKQWQKYYLFLVHKVAWLFIFLVLKFWLTLNKYFILFDVILIVSSGGLFFFVSFFWDTISHPNMFSFSVLFCLGCLSYKQHIIEICLVTQSENSALCSEV